MKTSRDSTKAFFNWMSAWEETGVMVVGRKFRCTKCKKAQHMANANYVGDVCPDCKPRKGRK